VGGCFLVQRSWLSLAVDRVPSVVGRFIRCSVSEVLDVSSMCRFLLAKLEALAARDWKDDIGL